MNESKHSAAHRRRHVTLAHVALRAGVSKTTASAALSGSGRISEQKRQHVQQVAQQLGYQPNLAARALRTHSDPLVGILLYNRRAKEAGAPEAYFYLRLISTLFNDLTSAGIGVLTVADTEPELLKRYPLDAILTVSPNLKNETLTRVLTKVPVIVAGNPRPNEHFSTVGHDTAKMMVTALDHLAGQGFEKPLLATRPLFWSVLRNPATAAYRTWCEERSIEPRILEAGDWAGFGTEITAAVGEGYDSVVAMVGNSPGMLRTLQHSGLRVPEEVGLVGIGEDVAGDSTWPAITMVSTMGAKSGHVVAAMVSEILEHGGPVQQELPYRLIVRESSVR